MAERQRRHDPALRPLVPAVDVQVGTADARCLDLDQHLVGRGLGHRHLVEPEARLRRRLPEREHRVAHGRNHADPGSPLRVVTDATPRSASTLDVTPMSSALPRSNLLYLGVGCAALVIAIVLILVSVLGVRSSAPRRTPSVPTTTTTATGDHPGASEGTGRDCHRALCFSGIPQQLNQLGNPKAKVTMIEFADLAVPLLPRVRARRAPRDHQGVRPHGQGEVRLLRDALHRRRLGAGPARGLRRRAPGQALELLDLLYRSQGAENSGWVTDDLLRWIGGSIPGFDTREDVRRPCSSPRSTRRSAAAASRREGQRELDAHVLRRARPAARSSTCRSALTPEAFRPRSTRW